MILSRLRLQHFRNYRDLDLVLSPGSTILYGANGAGKTNILESIFTLATTKSFRARSDRELIDRNSDPTESPYPFARVRGEASEGQGRELSVEIVIAAQQSVATEDSSGAVRKQFRLDGVPRRASDVVGRIKAVLFSPADVDLVTGSPSARRRYVDLMLCQVDPLYLRLLQSYTRIVQQRNGVLTRLGAGHRGSLLEVWDAKLVTDGSAIMARRIEMMATLSELARHAYGELSEGSEPFSVVYSPSVSGDNEADEHAVEGIAQRFRRSLEVEAGRPGEQRVTTVGPHRDDLALTIDGVSLLAYGSRGQQRTAALALRMAEAQYIFGRTGRRPVMLMDEALGELDDTRRDALLRLVATSPQVILTGTSVTAFPEEFRESGIFLHVQSGQVVASGEPTT